MSDENFDKAVHGGLDDLPVLPEGGDVVIYVKRKATVGGKAGAAITFTVQQTDGTIARAQTVATVALLEQVLAILKGWREGGYI